MINRHTRAVYLAGNRVVMFGYAVPVKRIQTTVAAVILAVSLLAAFN